MTNHFLIHSHLFKSSSRSFPHPCSSFQEFFKIISSSVLIFSRVLQNHFLIHSHLFKSSSIFILASLLPRTFHVQFAPFLANLSFPVQQFVSSVNGPPLAGAVPKGGRGKGRGRARSNSEMHHFLCKTKSHPDLTNVMWLYKKNLNMHPDGG